MRLAATRLHQEQHGPSDVNEARRRSGVRLDLIEGWEAADQPIDPEHLEWADTVLDRQGVPQPRLSD